VGLDRDLADGDVGAFRRAALVEALYGDDPDVLAP